MFKPIEVRALSGYRIWVRYPDGVEGEVDLAHLAGRGVFSLWNDYSQFEKVHVGPGDTIAWSDEVDLCPDTIYMRISGKQPEEVFPKLAARLLNA